MTTIIDWLAVQSNFNIVVAVSAVIVALIAASSGAYQAFLIRRHNRLSIRPHITIYRYGLPRKNSYNLGIALLNNGLGPAIISECDLYYGGRKIGSSKDPDVLKAAIDEEMSALQPLSVKIRLIETFGNQSALPAAAKKTLLEISVPLREANVAPKSPKRSVRGVADTRKRASEFLDKFQVHLVYHSLYREKISHISRPSWP